MTNTFGYQQRRFARETEDRTDGSLDNSERLRERTWYLSHVGQEQALALLRQDKG